MTDEIKLYNMDLEVQEWREGKFQRGDTWRSDAIYQCDVCGVRSNRWIMGGSPGMGPRMVCSGTKYQEHERLENYLNRRYQLGHVLADAGNADAPHVTSVRAEKQTLEDAIDNLRSRFLGRFDDIVGAPRRTIAYYPSSKYFSTETLPERKTI